MGFLGSLSIYDRYVIDYYRALNADIFKDVDLARDVGAKNLYDFN